VPWGDPDFAVVPVVVGELDGSPARVDGLVEVVGDAVVFGGVEDELAVVDGEGDGGGS